MRFSIWLATEQPVDDLLGTAAHAERTGWDGIYVSDHFMPDGPRSSVPRLEGWTTIAAIAAVVPRVRVGVLVTGNTYRHPAVLANMAATLDRLSGGRHVLGLGAGWQVNEHEAYGIELPPVPERLERLDEACQVVRLLHTNERSDFDGRHYRLVDAPCEPKPLRSPLPLLLGVSGERIGLRIAAARADEWNCWGLPDEIAAKSAVLDRHCEAIGRDPATIARSAQALVQMSDDPEQLERWRADSAPVPRLIGTPAELADLLAAYAAVGLDEFVVSDRTLGANGEQRRAAMDRFQREVAAATR